MAATPAAARLTEAHRLAQTRLGALTAQQMATAWGLVDPADLDATVEGWLRIAVPLIRSQRGASARLAAAYLRTFRQIETGTAGRFTPALADSLDQRRAVTSLTVTGPVKVKSATARGLNLAAASDLARDSTARAAMRLALDGGRTTIVDSLAIDSQAHGWARATSGNPCAFCALLAGRGPAYSEDSVSFEAHDGCSCTAEPVYDTDADWPAGSRQYAELYQQAKATDGDTASNFRQLVEG